MSLQIPERNHQIGKLFFNRPLRLVDIPIVFLSVVRDLDIRGRLMQLEGSCGQRFRFLIKPTRSSELVAEVQKALEEAGG